MNKFLPSGKFLLVLFSIILALGLVLGTPVLSRYYKNQKIVVTNPQTSNQISVKEFMAVDSDQDGLLDWEEALWKTDPQRVDTDGDGTPDGEETNLNRNPIITNTAQKNQTPNDQIDEKIITDAKQAQEEYDKLTDTEKFSRELFSQYVIAKNNNGGKALDNTAKMEVLNTVIDKTVATIITKYSISDIKNTVEMTDTNLKDYGNKLGEILMQYSTNGAGDELLYIQEAITKEDETLLKPLVPIITNYTNMLVSFILMPVPKDLLDIHIKIVNNFYNVIISLENIKSFFVDPINGVTSLQTYQASFADLFKNIEILRIKMLEKNIIFGVNDPGYVFINVSQQQ
jgi:hypothetical protein